MKKWIKIVLGVSVILFLAIAAHLYWLSSLNGPEVFPQDTYLNQASNKTALIVVAHDDDAIGCAGTVLELTKRGWDVHFLTFYGNWRKEDHPIRRKEAEQVARIQQLASINLMDFPIQRTDTVQEPWHPIPYSKFQMYMQVDSIRAIIGKAIDTHRPSVVFTLDNVIGGYGHPEHVCVSQCVVDICETRKSDNSFSVEKIYQAVFTKTLNENVLRNNPAFIAAKQVYKAEGSPIPTVEVDIVNSSKQKKEVMLAYASQKRILQKIWPYYHIYPHWLYFKIFDKEYFRVIDVK
jgi:LmbE family N-acetylglucosaminyl deacetylase